MAKDKDKEQEKLDKEQAKEDKKEQKEQEKQEKEEAKEAHKKSKLKSKDTDEDIEDGDEIEIDDFPYIAMYVGKDNIEWQLVPAGNNPNHECLDPDKLDKNKKVKLKNRGVDKHNKPRKK